jgi:hypothetical protein
MALLPPPHIEHDERGWHVRQGDVQLEGRALPPLLQRLSLTMEALEITADLDQPLRRDTDRTVDVGAQSPSELEIVL